MVNSRNPLGIVVGESVSFKCLGEQVTGVVQSVRYPDVYSRVVSEGRTFVWRNVNLSRV